jgi:hypothetical protein
MKFLPGIVLVAVASLLICVGLSNFYHDLLLINRRQNYVPRLKNHEQHIQHRNTKSVDDSKLQKVLSRSHHINNLRTSWGSTEYIQKHEHISVGGDNFLIPLIAPEKNEVLVIDKHNHHFRRRRWRQRKRSRGWGRSGKGFILDDDSGSGSTKRSSKSKVGKSKWGMSKRKGKGGSNRCGGSSKKSSKQGLSKKKGKGKGGGKGFYSDSEGKSGKGKLVNSNFGVGKGKWRGKGSKNGGGKGKGKGSGNSEGKGSGKGSGNSAGKGKGQGSGKSAGKGNGKGWYSLITDCETNFDDDISLAAPLTPTTNAPILPPTTAPVSIVTPTAAPSSVAPAPMAATSQPSALAPTSSSMGPTPERGLIRIRVSNWYIAYRAPDATTRAPTRMEYDAILEATRMYVENYFLNYFQTNMLDMIRYVSSESVLTTASYGTDVPTFVQQPSPSDNGRFNIYVNFRYIEFVYYDTSTPIPDEAQSYDLLQSALLTNPDEQTYIMQVPQTLTGTPFESTIDIVFGTVP